MGKHGYMVVGGLGVLAVGGAAVWFLVRYQRAQDEQNAARLGQFAQRLKGRFPAGR